MKVLASRLAKRIDDLVSLVQSAFIKGRSIQDNLLVQGQVHRLHRAKRPSLLVKLDIAKAFDSVSWVYLLDMLRARGLSQRWCDWIAMLLSTASSRVLLNGVVGDRIRHLRGLRQGDLLSPFLFILAMEPLQRLIAMAVEEGLLSRLPGQANGVRTSLYADDAVFFIRPVKEELEAVCQILQRFGDVTGLRVNFAKTSVIPIRCEALDIPDIVLPLGARIATLPCKFLGLPLSLRKLRKVDFQPLLDRIASRLACCKAKLLSAAGRLVLLNAVLSALSVYWISVHAMPVWVRKEIDRIRRAWLWRGEETCHGGHCKVAWSRICRPRELGGLGIIDLDRFGTVLRLNWLCWSVRHWTSPGLARLCPAPSLTASFLQQRPLSRLEMAPQHGSGSTAGWMARRLLWFSPSSLSPPAVSIARSRRLCMSSDGSLT
jgi:hypothetical protein